MATRRGQVALDLKVDLSSETCTDHNQSVVFSCKTCGGDFICNKCILQAHNGHHMEDLQVYVNLQKQEVLRLVNDTDERLGQLDVDIKDVEKMIKMNDSESDVTVAHIEERGRILKSHIDDIIEDGKKKTRKYQSKNERQLTKNLENRTKTKDKLKEKADECKKLASSRKYTDIRKSLDLATELEKCLLEENEVTSIRSRTFQYPSPSNDIKSLQHLFGKLKIDTSKCASVNLKLRSTFDTVEKDAVYRLCPVMEGDAAWVGGDECKLFLHTFEGTLLQTVELECGVYDFCYITLSNDLTCPVVACEDNTIKQVNVCGGQQTEVELFQTPSEPQSIALTADNDIVVVSNGQEKPLKLDIRGNRKSFVYGNESEMQLRSPNSVRVNVDTGDLAFLDNDPGCLYVCDEKLSLKFKYSGQQTDEDFDPQGVTFDRDENILIADCGTCSVILLDKEGHFIQTLITSHSEKVPQAVGMLQDSATHKLWVGYNNGEVETYTYTFK